MEDAATAEISRSQLWQWRVHGIPLDDGQPLTADRYAAIRDEELAKLRSAFPDSPWTDAAALLDDLVLSDDFAEFLTLARIPPPGLTTASSITRRDERTRAGSRRPGPLAARPTAASSPPATARARR